MTPPCTCTPDSIDGYDTADLPTWELALRQAAHGHYPAKAAILADAVREIDRLRLDAAAWGLPVASQVGRRGAPEEIGRRSA